MRDTTKWFRTSIRKTASSFSPMSGSECRRTACSAELRTPPVQGVHVLLKVYAKCIEGQDEAARRRIAKGLGEPEAEAADQG